MRIIIITLFPEVFTYLDSSIIKRARAKGLLCIDFVNPRDFTTDRHRTVDDIPYGGGPGMLLKPDPFFKAMDHIRQEMNPDPFVILTSPRGKKFSQGIALNLSQKECIVILCGHYEGFDERIRTLVHEEISIGDYVLTGGELPAQVMIDAVTRLIPGAIDSDSVARESFNGHLLDHPHYTRPPEYRGMKVPDILMSGHHGKIDQWRKREALRKTIERRPDLLENAELDRAEKKMLEGLLQEEHSESFKSFKPSGTIEGQNHIF